MSEFFFHDEEDHRASMFQLLTSLGFLRDEANRYVSRLGDAAEHAVLERDDVMRYLSDSLQYLSLVSWGARKEALMCLGCSPKVVDVYRVCGERGWFDVEALEEYGLCAVVDNEGLIGGTEHWMMLADLLSADYEGAYYVPASFSGYDGPLRFGPSFSVAAWSGDPIAEDEDLLSGSESGVSDGESVSGGETYIEDLCDENALFDQRVWDAVHLGEAEASEQYAYIRLFQPDERLSVMKSLGVLSEVDSRLLLSVYETALIRGQASYGVLIRHVGGFSYCVRDDVDGTPDRVLKQLRRAAEQPLAMVGGRLGTGGKGSNGPNSLRDRGLWHADFDNMKPILESVGCCYFVVLRDDCCELAYGELGSKPAMCEVLELPGHWFLSGNELLARRCEVVDGKLHVRVNGDGPSFVAVVVALGGLRWLATQSVDSDCRGAPEEFMEGLTMHTKVGASRVKLTLLAGGKGKATCSGCGKVVMPEGHKEVCSSASASQAPADARLALVGDAMHTMDVRVTLAAYYPHELQLSVVAVRYTSALAQRRYLERVEPRALPEGRNDHAWGTEFEVRYHDGFRRKYLRWLVQELKVSGSPVSEAVVKVAASYSSLIVQVLKDVE